MAQARSVTCSPCLKARGFSVRPRRHPRESPKGLPGPLNIAGRVLVAVQHQSTGGADVGAHAQTLGHTFPTATTILRGIRRVDHFHSLSGACCLESEQGEEVAPPGVLNRRVEAGFPRGPIMQIAALPVWLRRGAPAEARGPHGLPTAPPVLPPP